MLAEPGLLGASHDRSIVKETRRQVEDMVRNDWEEILARVTSGDKREDDMVDPPEDALHWQERSYAPSDPSSDESEDEMPTPELTHGMRMHSPTQRRFPSHILHPDGSDAESTDSPAETDEAQRQLARKKRRRLRLEQEMSWNEGLREFERVRDLWTRASRLPEEPVGEDTPDTSVEGSVDSMDTSASTNSPSKPETALPEPSPASKLPSALESLSLSTPRSTVHQKVMLPVPVEIIPSSDPARQEIDQQLHLIYQKCVVDSVRPNVPIRLDSMINCLLAGWREADEFPVPEPQYHDTHYVASPFGALLERGAHKAKAKIKKTEDETHHTRSLGKRLFHHHSHSHAKDSKPQKPPPHAQLHDPDNLHEHGSGSGTNEHTDEPKPKKRGLFRKVGRKLRAKSISLSSSPQSVDEKACTTHHQH